jgi:hypothetical protein
LAEGRPSPGTSTPIGHTHRREPTQRRTLLMA